MSNTNTGGPAFPYEERNGEGAPYKDYFGMTLRDYFAAKAMQPMVNEYDDFSHTARLAYEIADAMLEERNK